MTDEKRNFQPDFTSEESDAGWKAFEELWKALREEHPYLDESHQETFLENCMLYEKAMEEEEKKL